MLQIPCIILKIIVKQSRSSQLQNATAKHDYSIYWSNNNATHQFNELTVLLKYFNLLLIRFREIWMFVILVSPDCLSTICQDNTGTIIFCAMLKPFPA